MTAYRIAGYGSWSSPITSDFVAAELIGLADLRIVGGAILLDRSAADGERPQRPHSPPH
jgi:hypothetical protein